MLLIITRHDLLTIFFFFNDTATTEIYTLSLHDALPIYMMFSSRKRFAAGLDRRQRVRRLDQPDRGGVIRQIRNRRTPVAHPAQCVVDELRVEERIRQLHFSRRTSPVIRDDLQRRVVTRREIVFLG